MIKIIILIILLIYCYLQINIENYDTMYMSTAYGYPSYYTPIGESCLLEKDKQLLRTIPQMPLTEYFQITKYPSCIPVATVSLISIDNNVPNDWLKFVNHIKKVCRLNKILDIKHTIDTNLQVSIVTMKIGNKEIKFDKELTTDNIYEFVINNLIDYNKLTDDSDFYTNCAQRYNINKGTHFDYKPICYNHI